MKWIVTFEYCLTLVDIWLRGQKLFKSKKSAQAWVDAHRKPFATLPAGNRLQKISEPESLLTMEQLKKGLSKHHVKNMARLRLEGLYLRKVYPRGLVKGSKFHGKPTGTTFRCRLTGCTGTRVGVRWPAGHITYPCTKGMEFSPKGTTARLV